MQIKNKLKYTSLQNPIVNHKFAVKGCRNATRLGGAFAGTVYTKDIPSLLGTCNVKQVK